jgi:hypothetical protein
MGLGGGYCSWVGPTHERSHPNLLSLELEGLSYMPGCGAKLAGQKPAAW